VVVSVLPEDELVGVAEASAAMIVELVLATELVVGTTTPGEVVGIVTVLADGAGCRLAVAEVVILAGALVVALADPVAADFLEVLALHADFLVLDTVLLEYGAAEALNVGVMTAALAVVLDVKTDETEEAEVATEDSAVVTALAEVATDVATDATPVAAGAAV